MNMLFKVAGLLAGFISDKVNLINILTGFGAYWLHAIATTQSWIEILTPFITFASVLCLCGYNMIKFYRTLKNRK